MAKFVKFLDEWNRDVLVDIESVSHAIPHKMDEVYGTRLFLKSGDVVGVVCPFPVVETLLGVWHDETTN